MYFPEEIHGLYTPSMDKFRVLGVYIFLYLCSTLPLDLNQQLLIDVSSSLRGKEKKHTDWRGGLRTYHKNASPAFDFLAQLHQLMRDICNRKQAKVNPKDQFKPRNITWPTIRYTRDIVMSFSRWNTRLHFISISIDPHNKPSSSSIL